MNNIIKSSCLQLPLKIKSAFTLSIGILMTLLSTSFNSAGQSFNFSFSKSTSTYAPLSEDSHTINEIWGENSYSLPLGFEFNFGGLAFNNIILHTNGTVSFGENSNYTFAGLCKPFYCEINQSGESTSPILYRLDSSNGRKFTIEFKNAAFISESGNPITTNFQICISDQDNSIELRIGSTMGTIANENCSIGLMNSHMPGNASSGLVLNGHATSPTSHVLSEGAGLKLDDFPSANSVYRFISN